MAATKRTVPPEDRDYVQFIADLGIPDLQQRVFLAGLLRTFRDAAMKLDTQLEGYCSAVHAAVSRLSSSPNPREAPEHLWIRVRDRLGFFHDENRHAQRMVNVGLSFAYRHLEMNAISLANAQLLREVDRSTGGTANGHGRVDAGSLFPLNGVGDRDDSVAGAAIGNSSGPAVAVKGGTPPGDPLLQAGGGDGDAGARGAATFGAGADPPTQDDRGADDADDAGDNGDSGREYALSNVFERQPSLKPSVSALTVAKDLVALLDGRDDATDVCRQLLTDSLVLFVNNRTSASTANGDGPPWTRLSPILPNWWAIWEAPGGSLAAPPAGTTSGTRFFGREVQSTRWCYQVHMSAVNKLLQESNVPNSRYFNKQALSAMEVVERIAPKDKPRLPMAIAIMMLVATKDEDYVTALNELVVVGRGEHVKSNPLAAASCQAFHSKGLAPLAAAPSGRPTSTRGNGSVPAPAKAGAVAASTKADAVASFSAGAMPKEEQYTAVEVARKETWLEQTKDNRAARLSARRLARIADGNEVSQGPKGGKAHANGGALTPGRPPVFFTNGVATAVPGASVGPGLISSGAPDARWSLPWPPPAASASVLASGPPAPSGIFGNVVGSGASVYGGDGVGHSLDGSPKITQRPAKRARMSSPDDRGAQWSTPSRHMNHVPAPGTFSNDSCHGPCPSPSPRLPSLSPYPSTSSHPWEHAAEGSGAPPHRTTSAQDASLRPAVFFPPAPVDAELHRPPDRCQK